ncbi:MAG: hypothetical protein H6698_05025 [Myxococcales bacterium]|nr:hypothetical protein [Myxococcales bacterium]MCB9530417.1 hypothetical protein [Myxococcales bacterium]MCB9533664.1 hypothetical protein [Myxococcales bacterium]
MTHSADRLRACLLGDQPKLVDVARALELLPAFCLRTRGAVRPADDAELVAVENPWLFRLQDERAELAYRAATTWLRPVLDAIAPEIRDGVLHDWLYFLGEDLTTGALAARAIEESRVPPALPVLVPAGWAGRAAEVALFSAGRPVVRAPPEGAVAAPQRPRPGLATFSSSVDVLVIEAYGNRLRSMGDLIAALRRTSRVAVLNLARRRDEQTAVDTVAGELGLESCHWTAWTPAALAPKTGLRAARRAPLLTRALLSLGPLTIAGVRMPDDVRRRAVKQSLVSVLRMASLAELFGSVLRQVMPRLVVTGRGDDTILRALGPTVGRRGVPVIDVQHGLRHGSPAALLRDIHGVHLAVFGEASRRAYVDAGVAPDHVHTVGSLFFDRMARDTRPPSNAPQPPFIVYSSAVVHAHKRYEPDAAHGAVLAAIDDVLDEVPGLVAVVRPHPQEDVTAAAKNVAALRNAPRVRIVSDGSNAWLFERASAHVSVGSTTTIEAAALGTPAVLYTGADISRSFDEGLVLGAITAADDVDTLRAALVRLAAAPRRSTAPNPDFVRAYLHLVDGGTVDRILELPPVREALASSRAR